MKQPESQQYRHQSDMINITLLLPQMFFRQQAKP